MSKFGLIRLVSGAFALTIRAGSLTANRELYFPTQNAVGGQLLAASVADPQRLEFINPPSVGGAGTVTSVALSAPSSVFSVAGSPITSSGTLALDFIAQNAGLVLASPSGASGAPTFRSLVSSDIPNLDAAKISTGTIAYLRLPVGNTANTICAGNDVRLHLANTDTSTTNNSFQLDSGNSGVRIQNESGVLAARNAANTAYADIVCKNLTVQGTTTVINSNQVDIGDNIINLNSDYVGSTPTESGGFSINRGSLTAANSLWSESSQKFIIGLAGSEKVAARFHKATFTNTNISSNQLTVTHNLNEQNPLFLIYDDTSKIFYPDVVSTTANTIVFDFSNVTVSGTWTACVVG